MLLFMDTQGLTVLWPSNAYRIQNDLLQFPNFSIWGPEMAEQSMIKVKASPWKGGISGGPGKY